MSRVTLSRYLIEQTRSNNHHRPTASHPNHPNLLQSRQQTALMLHLHDHYN